MYIYGWNMPGFMPDCEPTPCDDWTDAARGLRGAIERHFEEDGESEESGDYSEQYEAAIKAIDTAESESDISVRYGQYVYWVHAD